MEVYEFLFINLYSTTYLLLVFNFLIYFGGVSRYIIQVYYLFLSNSYTSCPTLLADTSNTTFNNSVDNGLFFAYP